MRRRDLGRFGRRMRVIIRNQISNRHIALVPNPRDDRNARRGYRAGENLFIKCPQFLDRASTTPDNDDLCLSLLIEQIESSCNCLRCLGSLHERW